MRAGRVPGTSPTGLRSSMIHSFTLVHSFTHPLGSRQSARRWGCHTGPSKCHLPPRTCHPQDPDSEHSSCGHQSGSGGLGSLELRRLPRKALHALENHVSLVGRSDRKQPRVPARVTEASELVQRSWGAEPLRRCPGPCLMLWLQMAFERMFYLGRRSGHSLRI